MASKFSGAAGGTRAAASFLVAGAAITFVLMTHHPTAHSDPAMIRGVHGGVLLALLATATGLALYARSRGSTLAIAGLVPAMMGTVAGAAAGIINGFVVPALHWASDRGGGAALWVANQQFAAFGIITFGGAFIIWGADLWLLGRRLLAAGAWTAGVVPSALLLTGVTSMQFGGALFAYLTQAAFTGMLGVFLWLERQSAD